MNPSIPRQPDHDQDLPALVEQAWKQLLDTQPFQTLPDFLTIHGLCYQAADAVTPRDRTQLQSLHALHSDELEQAFERLIDGLIAPGEEQLASVREYIQQALIARLVHPPRS